MKIYSSLIFVLCWLFFPHLSSATITIDSVSTVSSTCTNNGVATVYATGNSGGALLYAITAGPVLAPIQNSNVFASLYPGSYIVRVYDVNFDSLDYSFQITGFYELPDFDLEGVDPTCPGFVDGSISVIVDSTKGLGPYVYEIVSPISVPQQSSPVFSNLSANTYFVRVTDACGNYQTRTVILSNTGTGLNSNGFMIPSLLKIGCDTMRVQLVIYLFKEKWNQPLTITYNSSAGVITKQATLNVLDTIVSVPAVFEIVDTIPGLTYGDFLNIQLTDVCGESVSSALNTVAPYEFVVNFSPTTVNCISTYTGYLSLKSYPAYPYDYTTPIAPLSFVLTDPLSGQVVDSGSCNFQYCGLSLISQTPGNTYSLTVTDGCGQVWQDFVTWPVSSVPVVNVYPSIGCLDSTATLGFECLGFQSTPWLTVLSGPAISGSTKPFYAFQDTIIYPQVFFPGIPGMFYVKDFPVGFYTFQVEDSCGNLVTGSFQVEDYMVANFGFEWYVKPSCLNNNTIFYNFMLGTAGAIFATLTDLATNLVVANFPLPYQLDSLTTVPIGNYALDIYYLNYMGGGQYFDDGLTNGKDCWVVHDTINILPYTNNSFMTNSTVFCNGDYYLSIEVDSTRGVPPYRYAIINGPQLFPLQDSSFFLINSFGNYLISMEDACGNNYTQQISVTSDSISPIVKNGYFCEGNFGSLSLVSSPYFTHNWHLPDGNVVTGDSLYFQPFTTADTGQYVVTTVVNINGCTDSITSTFYLSGKDSVVQSLTVCEGDSVAVGSSWYTLPGQYRDTLSGFFGCDSLVITQLSFQPLTVDSIAIALCSGDSLLIGSSYVSLPGIYVDTVVTTGNCKVIEVTEVSVASFVDSIAAVICSGDSFLFGGVNYYAAGIFTDTLLSTIGCDSLIVLELSIASLVVDSSVVSICNGDSLLVGSNYYSSPGIYTDTLQVSGNCKEVKITSLTVIEYSDSISAVICEGDSFLVGNIVHTLAGVYTDTLTSVSGCDSIVVLDLSFSPLQIDSIAAELCDGDTLIVGNSFYVYPGVYVDTISVSGNCVKVQVTSLEIKTLIDSVTGVLCQGDSFTLGNTVYLNSGVYTQVFNSSSGCDSIVVADLTFVAGGTSFVTDTLCFGDSLYFDGDYLTVSGLYSDTLNSGDCDSVLLLHLTVLPAMSLAITSSASQVPADSSVFLSGTSCIGCTYLWSGAATFNNPIVSSTSAVLDSSALLYYSVTSQGNCQFVDSVFIEVIYTMETDTCDQAALFIPNAFTPNNDGINDKYRINGQFLNILNYKIYNRWGELVYVSNNKDGEWDGNFRGVKCPAGVYAYIVEFENCVSQRLEFSKGFITLME